MGIEKFFNSLVKNKNIKENGITIGLTTKIEADYLYIDFNSIIYNIVNSIEQELNYLLYSIILLQNDKIQLDTISENLSILWNFNGDSIESYRDYFTTKLIDDIALERLKTILLDLTSKIINPTNLKLIYIAFDGVPQFSKMMEQKKRRYNGYVISKLKHKIFDKYFDSLSENRKLYELNKISYDRGKIISWNEFMKNVSDVLMSNDFKMKLRKNNKKLEQVIISNANVFGEGEKKILEHIFEYKYEGNYVIYSPDADMIILGIIALNNLSNSKINILRYNSKAMLEEEIYDTIDINLLCDNIWKYISKTISKNIYNKNNIINDIAFIFSLFGNDFLPKLESIDVRNDIQTLFDVYCGTLEQAKKPYLIFRQDDSYKINYINLSIFINLLSNIEGTLLLDTYMSHKYKNYNYIKKILNVERLYPTLKYYFTKANKIFDRLRNEGNEAIYNITQEYKNDYEFMSMFVKLESKNFRESDYDKYNLLKLFKNTLEMKTKYKDSIKGFLKLITYDTSDINSSYHIKNIREQLIHPLMEITDYDKELYKLERKIGKYEIKLNGTNFELGNIDIYLDSQGDYMFKSNNPIGNIAEYYETFFDISYKKKKYNNKTILVFDNKIEDLVKEYLKGLFWVFDNYFNKNNFDINTKYISIWTYNYNRVPLIYQVKEIISKFKKDGYPNMINIFNKLYNEVVRDKNYIIPYKNFMNPLEHYLYVSPVADKIDKLDISHKYKDLIKSHKDIFIDLDLISDKIWSGYDNKKMIDCRRITFLNKCNLIGLNLISYHDYMNLLTPLRTTHNEIVKPYVFKFNNMKGGFFLV